MTQKPPEPDVIITLRPLAAAEPVAVRLRRLLKFAGRKLGLKCLQCQDAPAQDQHPREPPMTHPKKPAAAASPPSSYQRPVVELTERGVRCGWCQYPHSLGCPLCYEARKHYKESRNKDSR
jgi:hypothetical protein